VDAGDFGIGCILSNVPLSVAPMSFRNSFVTTEIAEPTSARLVRMRVPASVSVA